MIYQKVYKFLDLKVSMEELKITNLVKFYTLLLLNQGPKHGYELIKNLEQLFGKEISAAHVYPFLRKLEKNKLIAHKKVEKREKKKYLKELSNNDNFLSKYLLTGVSAHNINSSR